MAFLQMRDGRNIYYEEEGNGKPVILVHGWMATSDVYVEPSRILAATGKYRCIRYDQCGHIRSEVPETMPTLATLADDLHEVITQLRLEQPILVGWSMGGMTVLEYVRRYGCAGLDRVVIVDVGPRKLTGDGWYLPKGTSYTVEEARANIAKMRENFYEYMRNHYKKNVPGYEAASKEYQDAFIDREMTGQNAGVLMSLCEDYAFRDHRDVLPNIHCPAAIFYAGLLPVCPADVAEYYAEHISGPTVQICFENASHALITEQPERFAEELLKFFSLN